MQCAIGGHVPTEPVVSRKSGLLFEKRLIEKEIQEHGACPVTKEGLALDDLLPLKINTSLKPRPLSATSIPGMLDLFHNEWDALMLELHSLRQSLASSRQELSHSLYQHDAACRVIARLIVERDNAIAALGEIEGKAAKRSAEEELEGPTKKARPGIPSEVGQELQAISGKLSSGRKKRIISETLATVEDIASYSMVANHPLHKTNKGGITSIAINGTDEHKIATAGLDGQVQIFDSSAGRIISSFQEHSKKVNSVVWVSETTIATASADRTVRLWPGKGAATIFKGLHDGEVVSVTSMASKKYLVSASKDCSLAFYDLDQMTCLDKLTHQDVQSPYTCAQCHPDGLLVGTGDEAGAVHVWEMKGQTIAKSLRAEDGSHSSPVKSIAFSENGYYMATAAKDTIKVWDLRRLRVVRELTPYDEPSIASVAFDHSGLYLGVGGEDARIYGVKQDWSVLRSFPDIPKKGVLSLVFGTDARSLLVGASDHQLRVFG